LLLFAAPGTTLAQEAADANWTVSYWDNANLEGIPVEVREEDDLDHDWGTGSPAPEVPANRFSARWVRDINVPTAGSYQFAVTADDGVRLWVDGELLVDDWSVQPAQTTTVDKYLRAGTHELRVDYFENTGLAAISLSWRRAGVAEPGWNAAYFNNMGLIGDPVLTRDETAIDHTWGSGSPAPGIVPANEFSARWTRTLELSDGFYEFALTVDDGGRLWIDGELVIDAWFDQAATTYREILYLSGSTEIEVQYYEDSGDAVARLTWALASPEQDETVTVDDLDTGFVQGGSFAGWRTANEGYDSHLTWTENNDVIRSNYNWARWSPELEPGTYEVFVYVPFRYSTTSRAAYWISHADGFDLRTVDQSATSGEWVSLGTYRFTGTNTDYVSLSDVTGETRTSRLIAFDAMRWERR
jgi:hypothetical protein